MKSLLTNLIPRIPFRKQGGDSSRQVLTAAAQREFTPIVVEHNGEANLPAGITKHDHEIVAVADLPAFSRTLTRGIGQDTLQQLCPIQLDDPEGRRVFALVLV